MLNTAPCHAHFWMHCIGRLSKGETTIDGKLRFVVTNVEQRRYIDMFETRDKSAVSNWLQANRDA
ncbi:hypothetical protein HN278_18770, partial [Acinetobacter baumannii]|nr:hypothetical protein [Acinetobacter baumannii]MBF6787611.1 hypothetical protein [Acinetobacter baumannii]